MKNYPIIFTGILFFASCTSNKSPVNNIPAKITETSRSTTSSAENGREMTATVNGKQWTAISMMPPETAGRIVGHNGKEYIGLPYNKSYLQAGKKIMLGEDEAADIFFTGVGLATTNSGEMEITKVDGHVAEGRFYFTCTENSSGKKIEITNGFFKIFLDK